MAEDDAVVAGGDVHGGDEEAGAAGQHAAGENRVAGVAAGG